MLRTCARECVCVCIYEVGGREKNGIYSNVSSEWKMRLRGLLLFTHTDVWTQFQNVAERERERTRLSCVTLLGHANANIFTINSIVGHFLSSWRLLKSQSGLRVKPQKEVKLETVGNKPQDKSGESSSVQGVRQSNTVVKVEQHVTLCALLCADLCLRAAFCRSLCKTLLVIPARWTAARSLDDWCGVLWVRRLSGAVVLHHYQQEFSQGRASKPTHTHTRIDTYTNLDCIVKANKT